MKPPMAHKIKRPFEYTRSESTNIKERFDRIIADQKRVVLLPKTVVDIKRSANGG